MNSTLAEQVTVIGRDLEGRLMLSLDPETEGVVLDLIDHEL